MKVSELILWYILPQVSITLIVIFILGLTGMNFIGYLRLLTGLLNGVSLSLPPSLTRYPNL